MSFDSSGHAEKPLLVPEQTAAAVKNDTNMFLLHQRKHAEAQERLHALGPGAMTFGHKLKNIKQGRTLNAAAARAFAVSRDKSFDAFDHDKDFEDFDESAEEYKREIFFKTIVAETVTVDFSKLDVGYPPHCECSQFCDMRQPNAEYLEQHDVVDLAPCIWVCAGQNCMFWKPVMGEKFWENALGLDGEAVAKEKDPVLHSEAVDKSEERVAAFWDDISEVIATPDEVAINLIVGHAIHPLCSCG